MQSNHANPRRAHSGGTTTKPAVFPRLLIAEEVALLIRKSVKTVYKWAAAGLLPLINLNGSILFDQDEILAWIDDHRIAA